MPASASAPSPPAPDSAVPSPWARNAAGAQSPDCNRRRRSDAVKLPPTHSTNRSSSRPGRVIVTGRPVATVTGHPRRCARSHTSAASSGEAHTISDWSSAAPHRATRRSTSATSASLPPAWNMSATAGLASAVRDTRSDAAPRSAARRGSRPPAGASARGWIRSPGNAFSRRRSSGDQRTSGTSTTASSAWIGHQSRCRNASSSTTGMSAT